MKILFKLLCLLGIHNWEINKECTISTKSKYKTSGKYSKSVIQETIDNYFVRVCLCCNKKQYLKHPVKYHPCKYVWLDENIKSWDKK
jgi:hypothetical protein